MLRQPPPPKEGPDVTEAFRGPFPTEVDNFSRGGGLRFRIFLGEVITPFPLFFCRRTPPASSRKALRPSCLISCLGAERLQTPAGFLLSRQPPPSEGWQGRPWALLLALYLGLRPPVAPTDNGHFPWRHLTSPRVFEFLEIHTTGYAVNLYLYDNPHVGNKFLSCNLLYNISPIK